MPNFMHTNLIVSAFRLQEFRDSCWYIILELE